MKYNVEESKIRISLIMPTYNRSDIISDAIDSYLSQASKDTELIIIDDGSNDETGEMLKTKYQDALESKLIRYIYNDNRTGTSHCRNIGLGKSRYEWIGYLDSDNKLSENYISIFKNAIIANKDRKCFYGQLTYYSNGKEGKSRPFDMESLKNGNYIDLGVFLHSHELYEKYGGFDESIKRLVDWDLILTYSEISTPVYVNKVVLKYNDTERSDRITKKESMSVACTKIANKHNLDLTKVATLIVSYNHENYIKEAIESALGQDGYYRYSIYISDDASTDGTRNIIKEYVSAYPDIIFDISNESNLGISNNYKKCFEEIQCDYLAILEGDDYWSSVSKIKNQITYLNNHPECEMVISDFKLLRDGSLKDSPHHGKIHKEKIQFQDFYKYGLNPIINFSCCMFRSNVLKNLPETIYAYRLSEISLGLYCAERSYLGYINKTLSVYRVIENGAWSGLNKMEKNYSAYTVRMVAARCVSHKNRQMILKYIYDNYIKDTNFIEFLKEKENIVDIWSYIHDNFNDISNNDHRIDEEKYLRNKYEEGSIQSGEKLLKMLLVDLKQLASSLSEKGSSDAANVLGLTSNSFSESIYWFNKASDEGNIKGTDNFLRLLMSSSSNEQQHKRLCIVKKLVNEGNPASMNWLGIMYRDGIVVQKNIQIAIEWFRISAEYEENEAYCNLFDILWDSKDPDLKKEMITVVKKGIENGNYDCMGRLGRAYREGNGVEKNTIEAEKWLGRAASGNAFWKKEYFDL